MQRLPGFWYPHAGPWAWVAMLHTLAMTTPGFALLESRRPHEPAVRRAPPAARRPGRELRRSTPGWSTSALAYGIGWCSRSAGCCRGSARCWWCARWSSRTCCGCARSTPPRRALVLYFASRRAARRGSRSPSSAPPIPWPLTALILIAVLRGGAAARSRRSALVTRGARSGEGPLDRLLAQLVGRARGLAAPRGDRRARDRRGRARARRAAGRARWPRRTTGAGAPRPASGSTTRARPIRCSRAGSPSAATRCSPTTSTPPRRICASCSPSCSPTTRRARWSRSAPPTSCSAWSWSRPRAAGCACRALGFLVRAAERLAEALLHARLARRAAERAALAREVELAATVQAELLPGGGPQVLGADHGRRIVAAGDPVRRRLLDRHAARTPALGEPRAPPTCAPCWSRSATSPATAWPSAMVDRGGDRARAT